MENNIKEILDLSERKFLIWLKKFYSNIPKEHWITRQYTNPMNITQHCAIGHLSCSFMNQKLVDKAEVISFGMWNIVEINDNNASYIFSEINNPKDRVIKAINLKLANKL